MEDKIQVFCPLCGQPVMCKHIHREIEGDDGLLRVDIIKIKCCTNQTLRVYYNNIEEDKRA